MPPLPNTIFYLPHEGLTCPISWQAMGEDRVTSAKYNWAGRERKGQPGLIWQVTLEGQGRIDFGGQKGIELGPGSSFLAQLNSDYRYYFKPGDPAWRFRYVIWRGPALESYFRAACREDIYLLKSSRAPDLIRKIGALLEVHQNGEPEPWQNAQDAMQMLNPILQLAQRIDLIGKDESSADIENLAAPIHRDPSLAVEKQGWAELAGLSRFQLYRRVKAQTGMSPKDLRNRQRLLESIKFLKKANVSVADAATLAGFSSQNYFARFFKKHTGYSPSEWRKLFARSAIE